MRISNVKAMVAKVITAGLLAGVFVMAAPMKAEAQQFSFGISTITPAYGPYDGYQYYGNHEDHERREYFERLRNEEYQRQQAYARQQAWAQHEQWEQHERHEAWERQGYRHDDRRDWDHRDWNGYR